MRVQAAGPRLVTNAASLMAATVATSALGLAFWTLAARLYSPAQVGQGSALVSAASLLAGFAQLSLGAMFIRHVPTAGPHAAHLIARALLLAAGVGTALAGGYVLLGYGTAFIDGPWAIGMLIVAVPVLTVFALQDYALIAVGAAPLVAYENAIFATAKLLALPLLTGLAISGVFVSWVATATLAVAVTLVVLFTRLIARLPRDRARPLPPARVIARELVLQYLSQTPGYLATFALPLVVVSRLGVDQAGFFALPWMIGSAFTQLNNNTLSALRVHATSGNPITQRELRHTLVLLTLVSGGGALAGLLLGPWILGLATPEFATPEAVALLQMLCLAAPLQACWQLYGALVWIERRMPLLVVSQICYVGAVIGAAWLWAPAQGLSAVGWASLLGTAAASILGLPVILRTLRRQLHDPARAHAPGGVT